jgi:hypothetical protein
MSVHAKHPHAIDAVCHLLYLVKMFTNFRNVNAPCHLHDRP